MSVEESFSLTHTKQNSADICNIDEVWDKIFSVVQENELKSGQRGHGNVEDEGFIVPGQSVNIFPETSSPTFDHHCSFDFNPPQLSSPSSPEVIKPFSTDSSPFLLSNNNGGYSGYPLSFEDSAYISQLNPVGDGISGSFSSPETSSCNSFYCSENMNNCGAWGTSGIPEENGLFSSGGLPLDNSNFSQASEYLNLNSGKENMMNSFNNFPGVFQDTHNPIQVAGIPEVTFSEPSGFVECNSDAGISMPSLPQHSLVNQNYGPSTSSCVSSANSKSFVSPDAQSLVATGRKRTQGPKMSLKNMTEEEKHKRSVSQNNEASKKYRDGQRYKKWLAKEQLKLLLNHNKHLKQYLKYLEYQKERIRRTMENLEALGYTFSQLDLQP